MRGISNVMYSDQGFSTLAGYIRTAEQLEKKEVLTIT